MFSLQEEWNLVANKFNLAITTDFELTLQNIKLVIPVLLHHFGAQNGMLLVNDYRTISTHLTSIRQLGYGFSCLPLRSSFDISNEATAKNVITMLQDWGWSNTLLPAPAWLTS